MLGTCKERENVEEREMEIFLDDVIMDWKTVQKRQLG